MKSRFFVIIRSISLYLFIIGNGISFFVILSVLFDPSLPSSQSFIIFIKLLLALANVAFLFVFKSYRLMGFWGLLASSMTIFIINWSTGLDLANSVAGFTAVGVCLIFYLIEKPAYR